MCIRDSYYITKMWRNLLPSDNFRRLFYFLSFKTAPHVRWVLREKSFLKSGPLHRFLSSEYWRKKFSKSFVQNRQNPPVGSGEKKFSETVSFGPPPRLPDERTKIFFENLDQNDLSWPVRSEGKIFLRKSGPLGWFSSSGYWGRDKALRKGWSEICMKSCHRN